MNKLMAVGAGTAGALAVISLVGAGTAAATPDVVGKKYSDASQAISDGGGTPKIAVTVGSELSQDDCIVTNVWNAPFVRDTGGSYGHASGEVMLSLNCDGDHATATHPGASVASPAGHAAKQAADKAEQEAADKAAAEQQQGLEEVSSPDQ